MTNRVLVVDDNTDAAESLATLIQLWGHQTKTAYEGRSAVEIAREFEPHIIFLDIGLPGMNGYEVARLLRADPSCKEALIVALTGWGSDEDRKKSKEAGFDCHLTKPVESVQLQELFRRLSEKGRRSS